VRRGRPPFTYNKLARLLLAERKRLNVEIHDLHALRYRGVMELAWAGCNDAEIASYSLHVSPQMIAKYVGIARQQMHAKSAAKKRARAERNGTEPKHESAAPIATSGGTG
jgi:hypothetical protein